jgi:PAS domain S-box-containing protein
MSEASFDREELAAALRAAGIGVWAWDVATDRVRWSPEVEALYDVPPGSFGGTFEAFIEAVHQDDRALVGATVERALAEQSDDFAVEHRVARRDGTVRWLACHGRVLVDAQGDVTGMTGAAVDVTRRKEAEREATESAERYRLFAQLASDYVYEAPVARGAPRIVAGSFERVTGYTPEELEVRGGWPEIVHPDDLAATRAHVTARQGRPYVLEYRIHAPDGSTRWLRDRGQPVLDPETGEPIRFVGGVQDITEIKELEARLLQAQRMEALAELAGRVAHDFNNLHTIVLGALGLMERRASELPAGIRTYVEAAHDALDRATELTRSLLTFGRHEITSAEVVDLREELEKGRALLDRAVGESATLHLDLAPTIEGPIRVLVDPGQLRLALMNLVINARDAMNGEGSVVVRLSTRTVEQRTPERPADLPPGPVASLEVIDHGPGIAPEHLGRIFEPYFTTKGPGNGTGLGLAIAYGVASKHGGAISVKSELGAGTTFTLWFPLSAHPLATRIPPPPRVAVGGRDHVLLVEDDEWVRSMIARILEGHGYTVRATPSAESALELSEEALAEYDLVLSDVRLGGMDGVTLAGRLRERCPTLAVMLVSGFADAVHHAEIEARGYRFVPKPFTPSALVTAIRETLDARGGAPG